MKQWILYLDFILLEVFPKAIGHTLIFQPVNPFKETLPTRQMSQATMSRVVHITYWDMQLKQLLFFFFFNTTWKSTLKSEQSSSEMAEISILSPVNCSIPFSSICSRWELFKKWASMTHFYDQCTICKMLSNQIAVQIRHVYCCKTKYAGWTECIHLY